jgi:hypothetical protein
VFDEELKPGIDRETADKIHQLRAAGKSKKETRFTLDLTETEYDRLVHLFPAAETPGLFPA